MSLRYAVLALMAVLCAVPSVAQASEAFFFYGWPSYIDYTWINRTYYCRFYCSDPWGTTQADFDPATGRLWVRANCGYAYAMDESAVELTMRPDIDINGVRVHPSLLPAGSWYRVYWGFDEAWGDASCLPCSNTYATMTINEYNATCYGDCFNKVVVIAAAPEVHIRVEMCQDKEDGVKISDTGSSAARWRVYTPGSTDAHSQSPGTSSSPWPDGTGSITVISGYSGIYILQVASGDPPLPSYPANKIPRYWEATTNLEDFEATMVFAYEPSEVPEGVDENDLVVVTYDPTSGNWGALVTEIDDVQHTATVSGINEFSIFILADRMDPVATEQTSWGILKSKYSQ